MTVDDFIRETAAAQYGLIGRRQIREFGGSRTQISHRVGKGMLSSLTPELLELAGTPPSDGKTAIAAVLDGPLDAVLSHASAAAWWDLPGFHLHGELHVTVPRQGAPRRGRLSMIH